MSWCCRALQSRTRAHEFASDASLVGVQTLRVPASSAGTPPFDFYYPAASPSGDQAGWFRDGVAPFLFGHVWFAFGRWFRSAHWVWLALCKRAVAVLAAILPAAYFKVPALFRNAPPVDASAGRRPLLVFSHGLTGTGEEHVLMMTHFVQQGFLVAAITHCDGSAVTATASASGEQLLYTHPDVAVHGTRFRVHQIDKRERELEAMRAHVLEGATFPAQLRALVDPARVFVGGFSYGAATAALTVTRHPNAYQGCVLLDGWFSIDLSAYPGWGDEKFDFPPEAHSSERGLPVPCCFIGSEHFQRWDHVASATQRLARKSGAPVTEIDAEASAVDASGGGSGSEWHVLRGSKHQNFCDVGFWIPARLLRLLKMTGRGDYHQFYADLLRLQVAFLQKLAAGSPTFVASGTVPSSSSSAAPLTPRRRNK